MGRGGESWLRSHSRPEPNGPDLAAEAILVGGGGFPVDGSQGGRALAQSVPGSKLAAPNDERAIS